ncbi:uncharacterized protein LOC133915185 [Phragmites australis]|uniref:uncharacterized protein LOC133915185 n=1 Tax=Phragmites australis TaxID=29695 RepID=UPI002D770A1C|nr:uncharacterized protein LOC133915185 [Phragmites australis]
MDTEPFDEAELVLPASPAASPPRRLKRLKKSSSQTTTTTAAPPAGSPSPPPTPPPPASPGEETLAPRPSPTTDPSPPLSASDADALTSLPRSSPNPDSSPLPPTDSTDEEEDDDGLDPLFSEIGGSTGWDPLGAPVEGNGGDEEEMLGGGLIEELRREKSAKKRLDMDEGDGELAAGAEATGKRSKRRRKGEAPMESARGKKRSEKERRVQLDSIHAESQRLLRETRSATFKSIVQPVCKPISSVLEKIRLRKLEILKKLNTPIEDNDDNDASLDPVSDSAEHLGVPQVKEVATDDKDSRIDDADKDFGANGHDLVRSNSVPEDEDGLSCKKDLHNCGTEASDEEISDRSEENHEENAQSGDNHNDSVDQTQPPHSSSPTNSTDDISSEDEEDNDKENIDPSTQKNDLNIDEHLQQAIGGGSCPDDSILKDFLDDEAEEEDDSDNDMMRFKDNEEDGGDENEVFNDLIAAGYEEKDVDREKRNELHQKWLQQQDAAETNNVLQRLKFGHQEQKELTDEDEDIADCEDESENEMSYDLTPTNVVRQNSEKAKQMIAKMFTDDNDTYEHSDDEEIEEHLARQRVSKREVHNNLFISPLEDDSSREVFSLIKKLNIAPQAKRRGKQSTSIHEMLMAGRNNSSSSKSSFLGRTASGSLASSHRSVYRTYVFGRDDSNSSSRSCMSTSESNSEMEHDNSSQPKNKKAKFSSSQPKSVGLRTNSEGDASSGVSLFEILRRSSSVTSDKQEYSRQESCATITESQAVHQFSAFKLSRRFSRVGARN